MRDPLRVGFCIAVVALGVVDAFAPPPAVRHNSLGWHRTQQASSSWRQRQRHQSSFALSNEIRLDASSVTLPSKNNNRRWSALVAKYVAPLWRRLRNDEVARWRAAALTFVASIVACRSLIDAQLARLWTFLLTSQHVAGRIFRTDSYEWMLAIVCLVVYIHGFGAADVAVRKASERGRVHPWRKYRLQDRFEADKHHRRETMMHANDNGDTPVAFSHQLKPGGQQKEASPPPPSPPLITKHSEWHWQAWVFEFWVYALPLLTWDILAPRRHRRLAPFGAPTTLQIMGGVTFGLLMYDFLFFCGHVLMHKIPFLYRAVHAKHHKVHESRASDTVRLSLIEEVLEVGFSIIALNLLSVHPLARSIYNCIITFLLVELHSGFDFPWTPQNVIPFGLATGSRRHHYHHRNGKHYYQKFFFHVDRLFGFFQKDDGSLNGDSVKASSYYVPPAWQQEKKIPVQAN